jgi:hypothetical protein
MVEQVLAKQKPKWRWGWRLEEKKRTATRKSKRAREVKFEEKSWMTEK